MLVCALDVGQITILGQPFSVNARPWGWSRLLKFSFGIAHFVNYLLMSRVSKL